MIEEHIINNLDMSSAACDAARYFKKNKHERKIAITGSYFDDFINPGKEEFEKLTE